MRSGSVAIIGRTNVGKSTFLNAALTVPLAITSPLPQTTRDELLGVVHRPHAQIAFVDTPGLHRPKTELGRRMNAAALGTIRDNDVVLFVTDAGGLVKRSKKSFRPDRDVIVPDDRRLLAALPKETPSLLMINKVDLIRDKSKLLPLVAAFAEAHPFKAIVPVSMRDPGGAERVLVEVEKLLPERDARFEADTLTDRPLSFFAREYVREQVLAHARDEVPHAVAVSIDRFEERATLVLISATIHVEKAGQGSILVGHGGRTIKVIGTAARIRIEELLEKKVHLELFVRTTERWKDAPRMLSELGYTEARGRSLENLLPVTEKSGPKKPRPKVPEAKPERGPKRKGKAARSKKPGEKRTSQKPGEKRRAKKVGEKRGSQKPGGERTSKKPSVGKTQGKKKLR